MVWDDLAYWSSKEWATVQENLDVLDRDPLRCYSPQRHLLFAALDNISPSRVKVLIVGQDPYPNPEFATGHAFSIPAKVPDAKFPASLVNIFQELVNDLHVPFPKTGSLKKWVDQGVILWNAIPSCESYKSKSHNWAEWQPLTKEVVEVCSDHGAVIVFVGAIAREFAQYVAPEKLHNVIQVAHPSPRSYHLFRGCRMFSKINDLLVEPIEWRL